MMWAAFETAGEIVSAFVRSPGITSMVGPSVASARAGFRASTRTGTPWRSRSRAIRSPAPRVPPKIRTGRSIIRSAAPRRRSLRAGVGPAQFGDVELLHFQHGLHRTLCPRRFLILEQLVHHAGDDLPGKAVAVLQPAAHLGLRIAAGAKLLPVVVDLFLV